MPPFTLNVDVAASPEVLFDALTTPSRLQRWLYGTEAIVDLSGPLATPGTTFIQRAAADIKRPGGVVAAERPHLWHLRLAGMGERAELIFALQPSDEGTDLQLTVDVRNGPRFLGPLVDRLTARVERRLWRRVLSHIQAEMALDALAPTAGEVYALEGGGWMRVGQVIEADGAYVHLHLFAGTSRNRPTHMDEVRLTPRPLRDHLDVRPLEPTMRSAAMMVQVGSSTLMADGGFGLAHCPMTAGEFRNARPRLLGVKPLDGALGDRVSWWRERNGAAFGEERPPLVGAYFSVSLHAMGTDAPGFGLVKLLKQGFGGVHVKVFSNTWSERPAAVEEHLLQTAPADLAPVIAGRAPTDPLATAHLALKHATFTAALPEFVATALIDPDELLPIEAWKIGNGAFA